MIYKISIFLLLFTGFINAQKKNPEIKITSKGYYIKKLNEEPRLWVLSHKKDTIKIYTNKTALIQSFQETEHIKSIAVFKDQKGGNHSDEFGKNGVIYINYKKAHWKEMETFKKNLNSKNIVVQILKTKDTVYLKETIPNPIYSTQLSIKEGVLKIRKNGSIHDEHHVTLFLSSNEETIISNKLKISSEEIKAIVKPLISFNSYAVGSYSLLFDVDMNKIIWKTDSSKYADEHTSNGKLFTDKNGLHTIETIEVDAMTGDLVNQNINDKVQIRIR